MSRRVLIVEDEILVADDLQWKLTGMGHQVVGIVGSGEEALLLAEQSEPDVVLMDIQLQGRMSGTEAAQIIHRKTGAAIIFITAFAAVFIRDPSQMTPPGICLSKPFSTFQLRAALESLSSKN